MILNNDGTPYQTKSSFALFDPNSRDHDLYNIWDQEAIQIGGSPIYYYEVFIQTHTVDPIYLEDRGKLFSPTPIQLYAFYEPAQQSSPSTLFGIDAPNEEVIFELNYRASLASVGHPLKRGSRIYTPHRGENWIIVDTRLNQFQLWGTLRLQLICAKYQESVTTGEGEITQAKPDFNIIG